MTNTFNPQEILKIAIKVEEEGKNLYHILEEKAKDDQLKEMWRYLKEQEEVHRQIFQKMLERSGEYIVYEFSPGEHDAYLNAIASSYVFTQELIERKTKELFTSDLDAIEFGIYVEKESILTYSALKEYVLADKQPVLDKVISEEKKHLTQLMSLRNRFVSE
jgi:rubrerythrin